MPDRYCGFLSLLVPHYDLHSVRITAQPSFPLRRSRSLPTWQLSLSPTRAAQQEASSPLSIFMLCWSSQMLPQSPVDHKASLRNSYFSTILEAHVSDQGSPGQCSWTRWSFWFADGIFSHEPFHEVLMKSGSDIAQGL